MSMSGGDMARIQLKKATKYEFIVNFWNNLKARGSGYETDVKFTKDDLGNWKAEITVGEMPDQNSPEEAADKLSEYLLSLSKAIKGRNIKHMNLKYMFDAKHK